MRKQTDIYRQTLQK